MALGFGALGFKEQGLRLWGSRFRVSGLWARDVRVYFCCYPFVKASF